MRYFPRLLIPLLALASCFLPIRAHASGWPNGNDSIFTPEAAAKPSINFDGRGFLINGKRTFIVAGELQYPRTPRAMWRDRLLRIKRAGYNTVQTYAFWNYHEPREGQFDFTGEKDLDAFLKLVHSLNLYAIVRMGPYVNAEWDTGGLPVWLRFKPGLLPMTDNQPFYDAVDPYFARLYPILVANQINHGGPILMVQLENEHVFSGVPDGPGGGTDIHDAYYQRFYDHARKAGLQVPLFFSGLNHNDDPAGDAPFDLSQRTSPWYSTEFWTGWVARYGMEPERAKKLERATWKVIAYGGGGYTHYTMAGGTDFDTWNNDQQASSYDFGSPIGQVGDLRDAYYRCKRAALFATSFPAVLSASLAGSSGDGTSATADGVQITHRKGASGEVLFLDNPGGETVKTQIKTAGGGLFPSTGPFALEPGEIMPVVKDYPLAPGVLLQLAAVHLLGATTHGDMTTLVAFGVPGEPMEMRFAAVGAKIVSASAGEKALTVAATQVFLRARIPIAAPLVSTFQVGSHMIRVLTMSADMADRTWFLDNGLIACGPDYVGEVQEGGGGPRLTTEQRGLAAPGSLALPKLLYTASLDTPATLVPVLVPNAALAAAPTLGPWEADALTQPAQPGYNDAAWKASEEPLPMGADGDFSAYAWYRATVSAPKAGVYQVSISDAGDWLTCFVNGKREDSSDVQTRYKTAIPRDLTVHMKAGPNTLAFLTAHYGRNKLFNYYGPLGEIDAKGIAGTVSMTTTAPQAVPISSFRWQADDKAPGDADAFAAPELATTSADWHDATTTTDVFKGRIGWAWFRATLPNVPGPHRRIHFGSIDDNGMVYLNGKKVAENVGINADVDVPLDGAWRDNGPNVLAIAVQNTAGAGGLLGDIKVRGGVADGIAVHGWRMRGGITPPTATALVWKPLTGSGGENAPTFYHAAFNATPPAAAGPHPILRATFAGLSRGFFWLNGRCLGRYPEKAPVDSIYLPESLLRQGENSLIVFDEDGNSPMQVKIIVETGASRIGSILTPKGSPRTAHLLQEGSDK